MEIYHEKNTCGNFDQSVCENHHFKSQEIEPTQTTTHFQQESFKQIANKSTRNIALVQGICSAGVQIHDHRQPPLSLPWSLL